MRWRLGAFLAGVAAVLVGLAIHNLLALIIAVIWLMGFSILVYYHRRVQLTREQFRLWRDIKRTHIARLRLDWEHLPMESVETPAGHPYAIDLDITGEYSMHRLLDVAVSQYGSERLKTWLLADFPDEQTIQKRQALLKELMPLTLFRDRLALNASLTAGKLQHKWNGDSLLNWLRSSEETLAIPLPVLLFLAGLAALNIVLLLLSSPAVAVTLGVYILVSGTYWRKLAGLFSEAMLIQRQITRLRSVFNQLENYRYGERENLRELCAPFLDQIQRPSALLQRISWITAAASLQRNLFLWMGLNLIVPWDIFFAYWLSRSKGNLAVTLPRWLDVWYELEALSSLANFAHLHPDYTFPVIRARYIVPLQNAQAIFIGKQLGHPLISAEAKVRNDFEIAKPGEVFIITGSNMAGKSSFLRTLGVNLVLAYAGSVTDSVELHTGLFRLFTCIRVSDSVVDGFSYFYAEVRRLKALLDALESADDMPLFYLIDEIFRGTNNRERLIGSRSFIQAVVNKNGVGLIATHDLELVKLADEVPNIHNFHFREEVINDQMVFDYRLRPGPSPTTNALKIMRLAGLPVEE